jgi:pyruvate dehydrogenase E2 component (dihydrolipoamide acetyltransferase)
MATIEVQVPDIGDFKDVEIIEFLIKVGDAVQVDQSLMTVESDKASMEIPSSHAGIVKTLLVKLGDKVNKGSPILMMDVVQASPEAVVVALVVQPVAPPARTEPSEAAAKKDEAIQLVSSTAVSISYVANLPAHNPSSVANDLPYASPSVRKFARELGVPLDQVLGTANKGRITQEDVQAFSRAIMQGDTQTRAAKEKLQSSGAATSGVGGDSGLGLIAWPQVDFAKFGPVTRIDRSRIKKISAANLHRNWVMIPHVTNHDDADITELEAFRLQLNKEYEKSGAKVTMLAFLMKACVSALKKFPDFNSSLDGDQLVRKEYYHIGFAADTPNGLVVPVIKEADSKGILQISKEMGELAKKARDGKLGPSDMQGATFTISSLGGIGGRYFTPIINAPEVAILGVCRSQIEPVWDGKAFAPKLRLPLSLSWDHRVIDGASAGRFNAYLGQVLADFRRILL